MVSNMVSSSNKSLTLPMSRMIVELHPPMRGPDGVYAVYIYGELHRSGYWGVNCFMLLIHCH